MKKIRELFILFISMFKIGLFTFGGGYAMISVFENEFVSKKKYLEHEEFMNVLVIAESTPGPIAINMATYIGYKQQKIIGAIFATLGMVLPSFTIIFLISLFFNNLLENKYVSAAFKGIQACVIFLILSAGVKLFKKMKKNIFNIIVVSVTFVIVILFSLFGISFSSIFYILISGCLGLVIYLIGVMLIMVIEMIIYLELFLSFFKIGLFTFGGGYAMISLVMETCVTKNWLSEGEILNFIAICESTPGPIAINMATFVGSSQGGILGSICATFGVVLPSFIIILIIAMVLHNLMKIKAVNAFIDGIKPVIVGLICATFIKLLLSTIFSIGEIENSVFNFNYQGLIIFGIVLIASIAYKKIVKKAISPILLILLSGILGILFYGLI